jgi:hypothetical protein
MALSFKVIGGDVPKQRVVLRPRVQIRGIGLVVMKKDISSYQILGTQKKNITAEIGFVNGRSIVVVANRRVSSQLSDFANQAMMSRLSPVGKAKRNNPFWSFVRVFAIVISVGFLLSLCLIGSFAVLVSPQSSSPASSKSKEPSVVGVPEATGGEKISDAVLPAYSIITSARQPPVKATVEVRLENKITTEEIESVAMAIRESLRGDFRRIFITYYLPKMKVGAGAWATSHWNPGLEVHVLGMALDEEQDLLSEKGETQNRIGRWLDETPSVSSVIELVENHGAIEMRQRFKDGSDRVVRVTKVDEKYILAQGEYLRINSQGRLEWYDADGLIVTCDTVP